MPDKTTLGHLQRILSSEQIIQYTQDRCFIMACAFGFPEIIARCPWSSLSNFVRQQGFEPAKIASQHILIMQLLKHELGYDRDSTFHIIRRLGRNYIDGRHDYRLTRRIGYSYIGGDHEIYELMLRHSSRTAIPDKFIH